MRELVVRMVSHGLWYIFAAIMVGYPMIALAILIFWSWPELKTTSPTPITTIKTLNRWILFPLLVCTVVATFLQVFYIETHRNEFGILLFTLIAIFLVLTLHKSELPLVPGILASLTYITLIIAGALYLPDIVVQLQP